MGTYGPSAGPACVVAVLTQGMKKFVERGFTSITCAEIEHSNKVDTSSVKPFVRAILAQALLDFGSIVKARFLIANHRNDCARKCCAAVS